MGSRVVLLWKSRRLRAAWATAVSPKVVEFVERLARSSTACVEQLPSEHERDSRIHKKYIRRLFDELEGLGLADVTRRGPRVAASLRLPVAIPPPRAARWPIWGSELKPHPTVPAAARRRIYDLDRGRCAYCGTLVKYNRAEIDHIYPAKIRGGNDDDNLAVACKPCNRKKWLYPPGHPLFPNPRWLRGARVRGIPRIIEKAGRFCLRFDLGSGHLSRRTASATERPRR